MEEVIKINGGKPLNGTIRVSGAKNATVALIPAAVLAYGRVKIVGIPDISDVKSLEEILEYMNVKVTSPNIDEIVIDTTNMVNKPLVIDAVSKLRASYYFMGSLLGKYKHVVIRMPGGCNLGPRPIDLHIKGFEALGAKIEYDNGNYILSADELIGTRIYLDFASVGATINILMAAVYAKGQTVIENAAREPEIIDCINMLNKMGARIRGGGTSNIVIDGVEKLEGCFHEIIPDRIEAGTYIILAAAMGEHVIIDNVIPYHLDSLISKLKEIGVNISFSYDQVEITKNDKPYESTNIKTMPFPGYATDLQAPLTALLTQAIGNSKITETIYVERFKHCHELNKMGANIITATPSATVVGPTELTGCDVKATDLRCGAALVVAGLIANGTTTIHDIYHIDRGYEDIVAKLSALGADIYREIID
ncbi:MAG TPA: UDP-N-acetylglucosamine 1-carboxyvinyltransferase [Erysipelotrichaceae bacterium]|jgi:UDP-N-acetylglucosamine 1-carboxyvinyltransferase|nr:UDP-N-acetylglucosamine 1-carboxyvinyltransferase [Erysipelotrichia bacterium]HPX31937.1 UDP-N-acetylglucosamine 1-carboxyvinyltransferase [Erysipelotrichaceae bacterium]HQA84449.1 UDP-N-acetylglucosamine 1-carboxyvinyltransferase [Erysipelotrichaceae bacterium]